MGVTNYCYISSAGMYKPESDVRRPAETRTAALPRLGPRAAEELTRPGQAVEQPPSVCGTGAQVRAKAAGPLEQPACGTGANVVTV
eukprot:6600738-Prymnesium_polylepis.2